MGRGLQRLPDRGRPRADGGGESIWDVFCRRPGAVADGFDGSAATDAYRRYEEDIACAAQMGLGAYRFSVSWARVDPYGDGRWNGEGFAFYLRMLQACRAAGLEPYVTLYHWELPQALEDAGRLAQPRDRPVFLPGMPPRRRAASAGLAKNYITLNRAGVYCKAGPRVRACMPRACVCPRRASFWCCTISFWLTALPPPPFGQTCPGVRVGIAATGAAVLARHGQPRRCGGCLQRHLRHAGQRLGIYLSDGAGPCLFRTLSGKLRARPAAYDGGAPSGRPGGHPHTAGFYWLEHLQWPRGMCRDGKAAGLCAAPARLCCDSAEMGPLRRW